MMQQRQIRAGIGCSVSAVKETVATVRKEWPGIIREAGLPEDA